MMTLLTGSSIAKDLIYQLNRKHNRTSMKYHITRETLAIQKQYSNSGKEICYSFVSHRLADKLLVCSLWGEPDSIWFALYPIRLDGPNHKGEEFIGKIISQSGLILCTREINYVKG